VIEPGPVVIILRVGLAAINDYFAEHHNVQDRACDITSIRAAETSTIVHRGKTERPMSDRGPFERPVPIPIGEDFR
jgi:hypothetical protein